MGEGREAERRKGENAAVGEERKGEETRKGTVKKRVV